MHEILVVHYSRTGKTRTVAAKLAALLGADIQEILEKKNRSGPLRLLGAARDTVLKRPVELKYAPDPAPYRIVLIGMPVWVLHLPAPVRAYVARADLAGKTVCAFCTSYNTRGKGAFKALNALLPAPLADTFEWVKPKADDPELQHALAQWAHKLAALKQRQ